MCFERFSYMNQIGEESKNCSIVDRVELPRINHATGVGCSYFSAVVFKRDSFWLFPFRSVRVL